MSEMFCNLVCFLYKSINNKHRKSFIIDFILF